MLYLKIIFFLLAASITFSGCWGHIKHRHPIKIGHISGPYTLDQDLVA